MIYCNLLTLHLLVLVKEGWLQNSPYIFEQNFVSILEIKAINQIKTSTSRPSLPAAFLNMNALESPFEKGRAEVFCPFLAQCWVFWSNHVSFSLGILTASFLLLPVQFGEKMLRGEGSVFLYLIYCYLLII